MSTEGNLCYSLLWTSLNESSMSCYLTVLPPKENSIPNLDYSLQKQTQVALLHFWSFILLAKNMHSSSLPLRLPTNFIWINYDFLFLEVYLFLKSLLKIQSKHLIKKRFRILTNFQFKKFLTTAQATRNHDFDFSTLWH